MRLGHFHFHGSVVKRSHGSPTRASAVSSAAYQANESLTHTQQRIGEVDLSHRKQLNKGVITEPLKDALKQHEVTLSDQTTAVKENRRNWTITDGNNTYRIKEFEERVTDRETGKRKVINRALDVYTDVTYDYTNKHDLVESWIQAPDSTSGWIGLADEKKKRVSPEERQSIWAKLEQVEVARDAQTATKISMALPRDLTEQQGIALVEQYVDKQFTQNNLMVDVAIHRITASDGKENLHAHLLIPIRPLDKNGEFARHKHDYADKGHYWQSRKRYIEWRKGWSDIQNAQFKELGLDVRVSHRSYKQDGIAKIPGIHLGEAADYMERRGTQTRRGEHNRKIAELNAQNPDWGYTFISDPPNTKQTTFVPRTRQDKQLSRQASVYPFDTTLLSMAQYSSNSGLHLGKAPLDPKLLSNLRNYEQVAYISTKNGVLNPNPQSKMVNKAIRTQAALKHPLQRHQHRSRQRTANWINQVLETTRQLARRTVQRTGQAIRQTVSRWTNRERIRRQQTRQTGIEHER